MVNGEKSEPIAVETVIGGEQGNDVREDMRKVLFYTLNGEPMTVGDIHRLGGFDAAGQEMGGYPLIEETGGYSSQKGNTSGGATEECLVTGTPIFNG